MLFFQLNDDINITIITKIILTTPIIAIIAIITIIIQ